MSVDRLHEEILIDIFKSLIPIPVLCGTETIYYKIDRWDWTVVTRVCHYWRMIAIGASSLWTRIADFHNMDKINTFLLRSGNCGLEINYNFLERPYRMSGTGRALIHILEHLGRIEEFHFRLPEFDNAADGEIFEGIVEAFTQPAPKLKILALVGLLGGSGALLQQNLSASMPAIETLHLTFIAINVHNVSLQSLKELRLKSIAGFSRTDFVTILQTNPSLESLILQNLKNPIDGPVLFWELNVASLRNLTISGRGHNVDLQIDWLRNINFNGGLSWNITRSDVFFSMLEEFRHNLSEVLLGRRMQCKELTISIYPASLTFLSSDCLIRDSSRSQRLSQSMLKLEWQIPAAAEDLCELIRSIVRSGYWRTTETVRIEIGAVDEITDGQCRALWAEFQSLRSIQFFLRTSYTFAGYSANMIAEHPGVFSNQLRSVSVECFGSNFDGQQVDLFQTFKNSLKKRKETNTGITKFAFSGAFVPNEIDVAELLDCVSEFHWETIEKRKRIKQGASFSQN